MRLGFSKHIEDTYGGKRGMLDFFRHQTAYVLEFYRPYRRIDNTKVARFVFVCHGNICRSAYAEAVANQLGARATSFGLQARDGVLANDNAIRISAMHGLDLSRHRATPISGFRIQAGDLLVGMEPRQAAQLRKLVEAADVEAQVTLLGIWGRKPRAFIQDPYGRGDAYFKNCFFLIDDSVRELVQQVSQLTRF